MTPPAAEGPPRGRILLLTPRWPYPVIGGDRLRIWHLARALSQHHDITLLSLCQTVEELRAAPPQDGVFSSVHRVHLPRWRSWLQMLAALPSQVPLQVAYYRSARFQQEVDRLLPSHDLLACHLARTAPYAGSARVPRWLEMTDAVSLTMQRAADLSTRPWIDPRHWAYRIEARRMRASERRLLDAFDLVSLVSPIDAGALQAGEHAAMMVAPNGVGMPSAALAPAGRRPPNIALVGRMDSLANRDALWFFVRDVLPRVRMRVPAAALHVVGHVAPADAARLSREPGVHLAGTVARLEDALQHCRVGVCPVRMGAGVQNKMLDYLAHGLASIASPIGLEGLDLTPGQHALCARSADEWVALTSALLLDDARSSALGEHGAAWARQHGSWERALRPLLAEVQALLERAPSGVGR